MADYDYDLFVIGAGSGGVRASRLAASMGARVAVAEERFLGGTITLDIAAARTVLTRLGTKSARR